MDQLKDIHLPQEVGVWPLAWGWWMLLSLVLVLCILGVMGLIRRRRRHLAKRQALATLRTLSQDQPDWPWQLNGLLKRLAISYFPSQHIASLHQQSWREFLQAQLPEKKRAAFGEVFDKLQQRLYSGESAPDNFDACWEQAQIWIKYAVPPGKNTHAAEASHA